MPTSSTFPIDLGDELRWGHHGELSPSLPFPPHHPPLLRRAAAEAEAAAAAPTRRGRLLTRHRSRPRPRSTYPSHSHHHHHHSQSHSHQNSHFLHILQHYYQQHHHHHQNHNSSFPETVTWNRRDAWEYMAARGMNIMLEEQPDWEPSRGTGTFRGHSARRRLPRRGTRWAELLAWSTGRRNHDINRDADDPFNYTYEQLLELEEGNVRCGLNKEQLAQLTTVPATSHHISKDCHICLESIQYGDKIVQLDCTHFFHKACIHPWLKQKRTCPICRAEL